MKLFYSTTSPYSRKVRLAIHFKKLGNEIEQMICNPFVDEPEISHKNPLGKVPSLIFEDGSNIFDSPFICEYLDKLTPSCQLYPTDMSEWVKVKTAEALGDGILDAAYNIVMEKRRPKENIYEKLIEIWTTEIIRSLDYAEKIIPTLSKNVSQAHISLYSTLGYLDFRLPEIEWRSRELNILSKWFDEFQMQHPYTKETKPY